MSPKKQTDHDEDSGPICAGQFKRFLARGNRHDGECYGAALDQAPGSSACAYLQVDGTRERLIFRGSPEADDIVLTDKTYILSPTFAAGHLFWSEQIGKEWELRAAPVATPGRDKVTTAVQTAGRPYNLASATDGARSILLWEERTGKRTKVRLSVLADGRIGDAFDVTDGNVNAYDPACCFTADGRIAVVYTAYRGGQYIVELVFLDASGQPLGPPQRLSNRPAPCLYPSVCPRPEGGLWFSYTSFDRGGHPGTIFVQHRRFHAQRNCFGSTSTLYAGAYDDGRTYSPVVRAQGRPSGEPSVTMVVTGMQDPSRGHVFTDSHARLHILCRQHRIDEEIVYADADEPLRRPEKRGVRGPGNKHPQISLLSFQAHQWAESSCLISNAYLDGRVSFRIEADTVTFAFQQDSRHTGWSTKGEWLDGIGQLGVGLARIALTSADGPSHELGPFVLAPCPPPSIEDPPLPAPGTDPTPGSRDLRLAIGQTHAHSNLSVCARAHDRDIDFNYRFMQDVQHSDFGATTDHAYNMWHTEMLVTRKMAEYYYFPGEFVAIPAYEWTGSGQALSHEGGPWGHVNPLYLAEEGDLQFCTPCDPESEGGSLQRTWTVYRGQQIVTPPHHVADHSHRYNWQFFDPDFIPVIELFQDQRGSGESTWAPGVTNWAHADKHWALPQLLAGKRFGFIASADHTGISRAGLWVRDLTRNGLYEAFMARRTFGTTALAVRVEFSCNDQPMGSEVAAESGEFEIRVTAPEPIAELQVVRNGEQIETLPAAGACDLSHRWTAARKEAGEFWYARIVLENGEMAWASPIWLV